MASRDDFEDYFHATRERRRLVDFTQNADGTYLHDHVQRHWLTWQVARGEREYWGQHTKTKGTHYD